jgi:hypothetical protein
MFKMPGHGATPSGGQYVQDDSGADMTMLNDVAWCVLGYTTQVNLWAGTAKEGEAAVKLDAVAPLIVAMEGKMGVHPEHRHDDAYDVVTIRFLGAAAIALNGGWGNLLSRNGVEHGGFDNQGKEIRLDNEVYSARGHVLFDQSDPKGCVTVPMQRWKRSSYIKMRPSTANQELASFMQQNQHLADWTAGALIQGTLRFKKVTMDERAGA